MTEAGAGRRHIGLLAAILLPLLFAQPVVAQSGPAPEAVGVTVGYATFGLDAGNPQVNFEFDDLVYGLALTRDGLSASVLWGKSDASEGGPELDLFDINLGLMGELLEARTSSLPIYVPLMLHSTYRRIRRTENGSDFSAFEYTGLGLGMGLGARAGSEQLGVNVRAVPGIGIATRSFGASTGRTTLLDTDVQISSSRVLGRLGFALGYNMRWQAWRVGGPDAFDIAGSGNYTYDGTAHTVRLGISW